MIDRTVPARFGLFVLVGLLAFFTLVGFSHSKAAVAEAAGATLNLPGTSCSGSTANVNFSWTPVSGASQTYLDLSVQDGTFSSAGSTFFGYPVTGSAFNHPNLQAGAIHWWRINSMVNGSWQTSAVSTFVPCGNPSILSASATCDSNNQTATYDFNWAPMGGPGGATFLDVGSDPNFGAGTFQGAGPLSASTSNYKWPGLKANVYYYYRVNEKGTDGAWHTSSFKSVAQNCGGGQLAVANANYRSDLYGSNDTFAIPSQGISANVNVRDVGPDGQLGDPAGAYDVVRYDFKLFPGMGGYPGSGGTTVIAGHVDYHTGGPSHPGPISAVFWNIRNLQAGDEIDYTRSDGRVVRYSVDWAQRVGTDTDWNSLMQGTNPEGMLLITCDGTFDAAAHEYSNRFAAHATKVG